jgi:hypothetical protein
MGSRRPAGAGTGLDYSGTGTEGRSEDCRLREQGTAAVLAEYWSPRVVAVLGAKAQLLGKVVMDDAALR